MRHLPLALCGVLLAVTLCACGGSAGSKDEDGPLAIAPAQLPGGVSGAVWGATLIASGGAGEGYAWSLAGGALPDGVGGLPRAGVTASLFGLLGAPGTYEFTVMLADRDGTTATRAYTVVVTGTGGTPGTGPTSLVNAPVGRSGHTAVWTGTEMIVWGGVNMLGPRADGAAYDPVADTWRTLPAAGAPSARFQHTAVWTGTEMVVWGGWDNVGPLATGAAYDPAANTWRTLPAAGAPIARSAHTAVWTGTAMIVWGGQGVFPPPAPNSVDRVFADGAAYDPVANQWTPAAAGGPATRVHTAVWTGTRMIVWGGRDSFALSLTTLNTGSVLDPFTAAWAPTDVITAPAARMSHTAVWTGALGMIVWGGTGSTVAPALGTGARYDPLGNTWHATSLVGAPSPRTGHTAVWTGTEMVIWGGAGPGTLLGDGAVYDPVTNAWRAVAGAQPAARTGHTAVWTGTQMIVWGGLATPADAYHDSGARIVP